MHLYIISHYFIPYAGIGTRRIEYFVRYLLQKGYRITLFKADNKYYSEKTDAQFDHINLAIVNVNPPSSKNINWFKAYETSVLESINVNEKPNLIIYSAGPFFYLKLSSIIKRKYDIPYIIDFRDTYLNTKGFYEKHKKFSMKRFVRFVLFQVFDVHKTAILNANYLTTVTDAEKQNLIRHYGQSLKNKTLTVRNGFNDQLVNSMNEFKHVISEKSKNYKIGIFGKFAYYSTQDVHTLLNAIISLDETHPVSLYLVGKKENEFNEFLQNDNPKISIIQTGFVSYVEGLRILSSCDILVLNNRSSNALGTKIFDYLALNKPIIAFADLDSEISNLLRPFENAFIVEDETECRQVIKSIIHRKINYLDKDIDLFNYSRLSQTRIFEEIIKSVI